uniref:NBS-LRR type resistance protein n=1 Tax=Cucumis melo TaxID=3656 RepID=A0A9I9EG87_CUCME
MKNLKLEVIKDDLQEQSMINKAARAKIRCWNSSPNLSQKVLNNYQGMRYARLFWVDDRATQKVFVEAPSLSHGRVVAIHQVWAHWKWRPVSGFVTYFQRLKSNIGKAYPDPTSEKHILIQHRGSFNPDVEKGALEIRHS